MVKRIISLLICLILMLSLTGCSSGELANYRPIEDVNNLEGRRIGVIVGWETDYILTPRDDVTLRRYDSIGEMVMALCYKQLDAIACDTEASLIVLNSVEGVEKVEPSIYQMGYTALCAADKEKLMNEFNTWLKGFKETDEYKLYEERNKSFDGENVEQLEIAECENPKDEIKVGFLSIYFPCSYIDSENTPLGLDLDIMRYFGRDCGYKINFVLSSESALGSEMLSGRIDIMVGGLTDTYREEYTTGGMFIMSDAFRYSSVNLIQVTDWDNLKMKTTIES